MPCISFFADQEDAEILLNWLNSEAEMAFVVPHITSDSPQPQWQVTPTINSFQDGHYTLCHLCVLSDKSTTPDLSPGHPAVIRLQLWLRHHPYSDTEKATLPVLVSWWMTGEHLLPASDFQWNGDRYQKAPQEIWRWWRRLKAFVTRQAIPLTPSGQRWSFWAFPSALCKLKSGMAYYARGWDLTEAILRAEDPGG